MKQIKISAKLTDRSNEVFKQYLREIALIEQLTPEEELFWAEKAFLGDKEAQEKLVEHNLPFVVSVAKQYVSNGLYINDLINEGNVGLIMASQKFDPSRGFRFISFAVWWIRKIILEHCAKHGSIVRLPANKLNAMSKLDKHFAELEQKHGRKVDITEVFDEFSEGETLKEQKDEFKDYLFLDSLSGMHTDSLDRQIGNEDHGGTSTLAEMMSDDMFKSTDHLITDSNLVDEINKALETLKPRDKRVIESFFGLNGKKVMTLKELGEEEDIHVTREMVRQIKNKTLKALRNNPRIRQAYESMG